MKMIYLAVDYGIDGRERRILAHLEDKLSAEKMAPPPYCAVEAVILYKDKKDLDENSPDAVLAHALSKLTKAEIEVMKTKGLRT